MRRPAIQRARRGVQTAETVELPAPFGGIDGRSPLKAMPAHMAVDLVNWWPVDGGVVTREGFAPIADLGTGSPVLSIHERQGARPVASSGGKLFKIDGNGVVTQMGSGFRSDYWRSTSHAGRLFLVNGSDPVQRLDDDVLETPSFTGPDNLERLSRVASHGSRLLFAETGRCGFWYGGIAAIQGELNWFPLDLITPRGGEVVEIVKMAPDGGRGGADDVVAFFLRSGDVAVYRGTDPGDINGWFLVGVFTAASPVVARPYGGDALVVSADGYGVLSRLLPSGRSPVSGFGDALGQIATDAVTEWGANAGWGIVHDPERQMVLVHVPITARRSEQHVLNLRTGGWGRWRDLPATAWGKVGGKLCLGTHDGRIARLGGSSDDGAAISATAQGAWSNFGRPGILKRLSMVRPVLTSTAAPKVRHVIATDFRPPKFGSTVEIERPPNVGVWDVSSWDEASWGGADLVSNEWRGSGVMGGDIAMGLRVDTAAGSVRWLSTSFLIERGGAL